MTNAALAGLDPDSTLQLPPDLIVIANLLKSDAKPSLDGRATPQSDDLRPAAVLGSAGRRIPQGIDRAGWTLDLQADKETLVCVDSPERLVEADTLVLYLHPLDRPTPTAFAPPESRQLYVGHGPRKTTWRKVAPKGMSVLTDGERAVALRLDGQCLVMDWFHRSPRPVFADIDALFRTGRADDAWVTLTRGTLDGDGWYRARPTPFELTLKS